MDIPSTWDIPLKALASYVLIQTYLFPTSTSCPNFSTRLNLSSPTYQIPLFATALDLPSSLAVASHKCLAIFTTHLILLIHHLLPGHTKDTEHEYQKFEYQKLNFHTMSNTYAMQDVQDTVKHL